MDFKINFDTGYNKYFFVANLFCDFREENIDVKKNAIHTKSSDYAWNLVKNIIGKVNYPEVGYCAQIWNIGSL